MDLTEKVNQVIRTKLKSMNCISGKLSGTFTPGTFLVTMQGKREAQAPPVFFWEWTNKETPVLREYLESNSQWHSFQVEADLVKDTFVYSHTTTAEYKQQQQKAEDEEKKQEEIRQEEFRKKLLSEKNRIGNDLAEKVASRLDQGGMLAYDHRDYCGMGLWRNDAGDYCYGEVWDHGLHETKAFREREEFVKWLSKQSNASLSMANAKEKFYRGNQVITKQRLEDFAN